VSASPIAIVPRDALGPWCMEENKTEITNNYALKIMSFLERNGAMFTRDIEQASGLLRPHLEEGLRSLVYAGRVTADAFSPLRWVLRPERQKARIEKRRGAVASLPVGRWSLMPVVEADHERPLAQRQQALAQVCFALLRRYGVVFRAVIQRETLLPPWRELLRAFRRLEDRGEVRGGRFVDGFSGEQFALPEAVGLLRTAAGENHDNKGVVISASDPLNLGGWLTPGPRTPAGLNNRVLLYRGLPVARMVGDQFEELPGLPKSLAGKARERLTIISPWRARRA